MNSNQKRALGAALLTLRDDTVAVVVDYVRQYRGYGHVETLIAAIDTPARVRASLTAKIAQYNAAHGANAAQTLLAECLTIAQAGVASPETVASLNTALATLATQMTPFVTQRNGGASWDAVATSLEAAFPRDDALDLMTLPVPAGYQTVWGTPWTG